MTKTDAEALEKMAESNAYPHHDVWVYEAKALFRALVAEKRAEAPVDVTPTLVEGSMPRPTNSNADEWALFLEHWCGQIQAKEFVAVQIAEAIDATLLRTPAEALDCPICKNAMTFDDVKTARTMFTPPMHFQCEHCGTIVPKSALAAAKRAAVPVDAEREKLAKWCDEAARYFERRQTNGEDMAHWSNVMNAQNARKAATLLRTPAEAPDDAMVERAARKLHASFYGFIEGCPANWGDVDKRDGWLSAARAALLAARQGEK